MEIESDHLQCIRGVPEVLIEHFFHQRFIPPPFNDPTCIRQIEFDKALLPLYRRRIEGEVTLFTWVMPGGMGDYYSSLFMCDLLKKACPEIAVQSVYVVHESQKNSVFEGDIIWYRNDDELISEECIERVRKHLPPKGVVIQIPTCIPFWERIKGDFSAATTIGEYGFLDSTWCHPLTGNRAMGLHGLEYGIMIKETQPPQMNQTRSNFFVGYLVSERGYRLYLRAIAEFCRMRREDITVALPGFFKWPSALKDDPKLYPFLKDRGIRALKITVDGYCSTHQLQEGGKTMHVQHMPVLSQEAYSTALLNSETFFAVRGNQSFTEALSLRKPFFFDGPPHAKPFIKDLIALVDERIGSVQLSQFVRLFLQDPKVAEKEFRDVRFLQEEEEDLDAKGILFAQLIQDPALKKGFEKLCDWITSKHNANETLVAIVCRTLFHAKNTSLSLCEKTLFKQYCNGLIDMKTAQEIIERNL